jgi:hypothetical protein
VVAGAIAAGSIAWRQLHNPIIGWPDAAAKDQAAVHHDGQWHLFFSYLTAGPQRWQVGKTTSVDWATWSRPLALWSGGSPDLVRAPDGTWVLSYTSLPREADGEAKLWFRTSADLERWSEPRRLAPSLHPGPDERVIDSALAFAGSSLVLAAKSGQPDSPQVFEIAWSSTGAPDGPWQPVGRPEVQAYGDTFENFQFVPDGEGGWLLVATSNTLNRPWLFKLAGEPGQPEGWLSWEAGRELSVAQEAWNTGSGWTGSDYEGVNCCFLVDQRTADGYWYLLYAGSRELTEFGGWGHAKVGAARSPDLLVWELPTDS